MLHASDTSSATTEVDRSFIRVVPSPRCTEASRNPVQVGSFLPGIAGQVDAGTYPADEATLDTQLPPIGHLVHESAMRGIDVELPRFTETLVVRAIEHGHGGDSYARIVEQLRTPSVRSGQARRA